MPVLTVRNISEITLKFNHRMVNALIVSRSGLYYAADSYFHGTPPYQLGFVRITGPSGVIATVCSK